MVVQEDLDAKTASAGAIFSATVGETALVRVFYDTELVEDFPDTPLAEQFSSFAPPLSSLLL